MFCPVCKSEFRDDFTVCKSCGVGLVEDLNNLPEKIEGELLICVECENEFVNNEEYCPNCGIKLVRALEGEDGYILLEEPVFENVPEEKSYDLSEFKHCIDLSEEPSEILLESEDMEIMHNLMALLDKSEFDFCFEPPSDQPASSLGSVFGVNSPLARTFPRIVVRKDDIIAATELISNNTELGLFDVPDELMDFNELEEEPEDDNL